MEISQQCHKLRAVRGWGRGREAISLARIRQSESHTESKVPAFPPYTEPTPVEACVV
jgi:hypothetical protein